MDSLAVTSSGGVIRKYPIIAGIDLSGIVVSSSTDKFKVGQHVLVTGSEVGMTHTGGFSEYARIPAEWVVPLPHRNKDGTLTDDASAYRIILFLLREVIREK